MINSNINKVTNNLKILEEDIVFRSEYVPMIIAELSPEQIRRISRDENVKSLSLYTELEITDPPAMGSWNSLTDMKELNGFSKAYQKTGLTGRDTIIGILDHGVPYADPSLDIKKFQILGWKPNTHEHAVNSAHIITGLDGIAPNIEKVYCAGLEDIYPEGTSFYYGVENLMGKGVSVINASINIGYHDKESYLNVEKWLDYMIDAYNVTFVQSAGNNAGDLPILTLGLCYNTITVGAMDDMGTSEPGDDLVFGYSSYNHLDGCYKPDLIAPANVLGGGTSSAAPVVTGLIALMLELKPSLEMYPQAIKAILLASCHRKALDPITWSRKEFMKEGLTNKQGAGVLDPFIALSIVANEQYGLRELSGRQDTIHIVQPPYGSKNMNVSIAWEQKNDAEEWNYPNPEVSVGKRQSLDLDVYLYNECLGTSTKGNSSTQMVYVDLSHSFDYEFRIFRYEMDTTPVVYAYAWSIDHNEKLYQPIYLEGIYCIKNKNSDYYLDLNAYETDQLLQYGYHGKTNQQWVIRKSNYAKKIIKTNFYNMSGGIGIGDEIDSNNVWAVLNKSNQELRLSKNRDGSYTILIPEPSSRQYALTIPDNMNIIGARARWCIRTESNSQRWYLERLNYQKGDIDMNGKIDNVDSQQLNQYLKSEISLSEVKLYLADVNNDGLVSSEDVISLDDKIVEFN